MMKIKWWWYFVPLLLLQLPFAFSPMCVWDSAVQQHLYDSNNFSSVKKLFFDSSVPLSYYEMRAVAILPQYLIIFKIFSILIFGLTALVTSKVLLNNTSLTHFEVYFVCVGSFFFPSYAMWQHIIMFPYYVSMLAFTIGVAGFMHSQYTEKKGFAVLSVFCFLVAFNIQSFLVYYVALMFCFFLFKKHESEAWFQRVIGFIKTFWFFIALPFLYYIFINSFFPRAAFYKEDGYNTISLHGMQPINELAKSLVNTSLTPFVNAFHFLKSDPISGAIYIGIAMLLTIGIALKIKSVSIEKINFKLLITALILAVFAILPYALVGKHVSTHGYETRHSLLMHTPLLIALVVAFRLFGSYARILTFAFLGFSFFMYLQHAIQWENRFGKYQAISLKLESNEQAKRANIVFLTETNHEWAMNEYLRFYECNMLLKDAFKNEQRFGINDESVAHDEALANTYIQKYLKYKKSLFFNDFTSTAMSCDLTITEQPSEDATVFLNSLTAPERGLYYANLITLGTK